MMAPLSVLACAAELGALFALLAGQVPLALGLHAGGALLVGAAVWPELPPLSRSQVALRVLAAIAFALTTPVIGALAICAIALPATRRGRARALPTRLVSRPLPRFSEEALDEALASTGQHVRTLSPAATLEQRIAATKALRHMESARAVPLLRRALTDPAEDVRLLAHAILDRRERVVRVALNDALARLVGLRTSGAGPAACAAVHAELASRYWELCYAGFAAGTDETTALKSAAEHAALAIETRPSASILLLAVRASLKLRRLEEAERMLALAARASVPPAQLAPLRAELAYLMRRFDHVATSLRTLPELSHKRAELEDISRFWSRRGS